MSGPERTMRSLLALVIAAGSGCLGPDNRFDGGALEPYPDSPTVIVAGYVWDPEALQYSFGMCGPACSLRPTITPGQAYFERSLVSGAEVKLLDLTPGGVSYATRSADSGTWVLGDVARGPEPWLYTLAWRPTADAGSSDAGPRDAGPADAGRDAGSDAGAADSGPGDAGPADAGEPDAGSDDAGPDDAGEADAGPVDAGLPDAGSADAGRDAGPDAGATDAGPRDGGPDAGSDAGAPPTGPFQGPVPQAATYFPTVSINSPIVANLYQCVGRPAAVIGSTGILDAVARHLTNTGTPTVASDFVNQAKFGGVIVWWAYAPGGATTRAGAGGTMMTASGGQVVYVQWGCPLASGCPPGTSIPDGGMASKSARNFYVLPGATSTNVGISVTLLPPAGVAPSISFTAADPVYVDGGRPWVFAPLPHVTAVPGAILFGETQALPGVQSKPAAWECVPEVTP